MQVHEFELEFLVNLSFRIDCRFEIGMVLQFGRRSPFRRSDVFQIIPNLLRFLYFSTHQKSIYIREEEY